MKWNTPTSNGLFYELSSAKRFCELSKEEKQWLSSKTVIYYYSSGCGSLQYSLPVSALRMSKVDAITFFMKFGD